MCSCMSVEVALSMQVPSPIMKAKDGPCMGGTIGGSFRSGMIPWETSFVLLLSRHGDLAQTAEVKELMLESGMCPNGWEAKSAVELGAGLGLPSIVVSNLGTKMVATDGDDAVLHLLGMNMERNAPSCWVEKLLWGSTEPLAALGLRQEPDFVLAANVVYDPKAWDALVETIKALSGSSTLAVIANMRGPEHDAAPFYKALSQEFAIKLLSQSLLHPAFRRHGDFSCLIHVLKRKT